MNYNIKEEITMLKSFFSALEDNHLEKGDKFSGVLKSKHFYWEGESLCGLVNRGVLEIVGREFVAWRKDAWSPRVKVSPEDILSGRYRGTFYSRNIYKVRYDNIRDYMADLLYE